jgi:hypothetical protein
MRHDAHPYRSRAKTNGHRPAAAGSPIAQKRYG